LVWVTVVALQILLNSWPSEAFWSCFAEACLKFYFDLPKHQRIKIRLARTLANAVYVLCK